MKSLLTVLAKVAFLLLAVLTEISLGQVTVFTTTIVTVCSATTTHTTTPTTTTTTHTTTSSSAAVVTTTSTITTTITITPTCTTATTSVVSTCTGSGTVLTAQYATDVIGQYTVWNNLWGIAAATSGSQTATVYCLTGNSLSWSTTWNWQGGQYNVKSYTNAALDFSSVQLSTITSIPTVWDWSTDDTEASVYDVSYDTFLTASSGSADIYEVMVWVKAEGGAGPLGSSVGTYSINGYTWTLFSGTNGATTVYSFVATTTITNVNFDLNAFYTTLISLGHVSSSDWLADGAIGAGTEPFTGATTLTVTAFSVSINA